MKNKKKAKSPAIEKIAENVKYKFSPYPRPICLEKCTITYSKGYEDDILKTLKSFSNKEAFDRRSPHKLEGSETWSIDVRSRTDKYRMLFYFDDRVCKITDLCTDKTH